MLYQAFTPDALQNGHGRWRHGLSRPELQDIGELAISSTILFPDADVLPNADALELVYHRLVYVSSALCLDMIPLTRGAVGFLASTWHVRSDGAFAASCIGVVLLVVVLEALRRTGKEYDSYLLRSFQQIAASRAANEVTNAETPDSASNSSKQAAVRVQSTVQYLTLRPTFVQQLIRSVIHMSTFAVAYFVMLLAMYFNGYIIISIFIGALIGKFACDWTSSLIAVGPGEGSRTAQGERELAN